MTRNFGSLFLTASLLTLPAVLSAQASASVGATASVLAQLSASGAADLEFGDVIPGFSRTVAPGEPDAGRFIIGGAGALGVSLSFAALPNSLLHSDGVTQLPISFGGGSAAFGPSASVISGLFDPSAGQTTNLVNDELHVLIGGTVAPAAGQPAGSYSGVITLDVAYTGN